MLFLALALILLFVAFGTTGLACLRLCGAQFERLADQLFAACWLGVGVGGLLLMGLSIAVPLSWSTGIACGLLLSTLPLASRWTRLEWLRIAWSCDARSAGAFGVLLLGASLYMSQPVSLFDSGLYHYGAIRWLGNHGAVPGLALLHHRFGFSSTWFALSAVFDHGLLEARMVVVMNAFALVLSLSMCLVAARRHIEGAARASDTCLLAASCLVAATAHWFHPIGISGSPNYPIILLTVAVGWSMLVGAEGGMAPLRGAGGEAPPRSRLVPTLIAVGALGVKVLSLPVLVVSFIQWAMLLRSAEASWRVRLLNVAGSAALVVALVLPIAGFDWIVSGCYLFPASWSCTAGPWSVSPLRAAEIAQSVRDWSRWAGPTPVAATDWNWIGAWLREGVAPKAAYIGSVAVGLTLGAVLISGGRRQDARDWFALSSVLGLVVFWCAGVRGLLVLAAVATAALVFRRVRFSHAEGESSSSPDPGGTFLAWFLAALGVSLLTWLLLSRALNTLMISVPTLALLKPGRDFEGRSAVICLGVVGIVFNLHAAPGIWYSLGYVAVLFGAWVTGHAAGLGPHLRRLASMLPRFSRRPTLTMLQLLAAAALLLAVIPLERQVPWPYSRLTDARPSLLIPSVLPKAPVARAFAADFAYFHPLVADQCWASPLPCTPEPMCGVALRSPAMGLRGGFVSLGTAPSGCASSADHAPTDR